MRRVITIVLLIVGLSLATGCTSLVDGRGWRWWGNQVKEDAKAFSGTGQHLGMSDSARDIEDSLSKHRQ
jgi:hypothetical protein